MRIVGKLQVTTALVCLAVTVAMAQDPPVPNGLNRAEREAELRASIPLYGDGNFARGPLPQFDASQSDASRASAFEMVPSTPELSATKPTAPSKPQIEMSDDKMGTAEVPVAAHFVEPRADEQKSEVREPASDRASAEPKFDWQGEMRKQIAERTFVTPNVKSWQGISAFYALRDGQPLWWKQGHWSLAALTLQARVERAGDDGLDIRAFTLPSLSDVENKNSPQEIVAAELALSDIIVAYGQQASGGRVDPKRVSASIAAKPEMAEVGAILVGVADESTQAGNVLQAFNPPHSGYERLRQKLAELRHIHPSALAQRNLDGPALHIGMHDTRVPLIRAHFGLKTEAAAEPNDLLYDVRLADAVADFQKTKGLPASGVLTARTVAALSGGEPIRLENEIIANMERWRWLPRQMGTERIEVNIPDYLVRIMNGDEQIYQTRVVVGKPDTPTPIFSNEMQYLIVNPSWSVPASIIRKEFMPKLAVDPDYLSRMGYQVVERRGRLSVRQPPGERNALGQIKFMFPNNHSVYLHDTPSRALFLREARAFSHGCVRVDQPFAFAEQVMGARWTEERLRSLVGGSERKIDLPKALPIHLEYFTVTVDANGHVRLSEDIYGISYRLQTAMGLQP